MKIVLEIDDGFMRVTFQIHGSCFNEIMKIKETVAAIVGCSSGKEPYS